MWLPFLYLNFEKNRLKYVKCSKISDLCKIQVFTIDVLLLTSETFLTENALQPSFIYNAPTGCCSFAFSIFTIPFFIHSLYLCHIHISLFDTGIRCTQCNTNTNTHTAYMWKILQLLCKVKKEQQIFFSLFSHAFCTFSIHTHSYSIFDNNIFVLLSNEQ